jgi:predicted ribosome-associated RNA-binding protein Tma20
MENIQTSEKPKEEQTGIGATTPQPARQIKTEVLGKTSLKSSQEKSLRKQLTDCIPNIADLLEKIWPKKSNILVGKIKNSHTTVYFVNDEPVFIQVGEEKVLPHIRLLHKCIK